MNVRAKLAEQHAAYEADLEPDSYGLHPFDTTMSDGDLVEPPCNYCHALTACGCIDRGSPFTHRQ